MAFSAVSVGVFMSTLDGSIVNVALPSIRHDLGATIAGASLVVSAYLLTVTATLLGIGRLGDLFGLRRVYTAGMLVFTLGSCCCGLARSLGFLVAARVLQALGAAAMMAIPPAAVTAVFPRERRGRALGAISSVVAAGLTAGPPIGGAIVSTFSWPGIFFVNLPVGILGALWAWRALPADEPVQGARFDVPGAVWMALALASFLGAIDLAPTLAAGAGALLAISAVAAMLLWRRERRALSPLIDATLFRDRAFSLAIVAALLSYSALFTQTLLSPFYLAQVKGLGPGALGAMLTCVPLALSVTAPIAGSLADRFGARGPCIAGALILGAGLFSLSIAGAGDSLPSFAARLGIEGVGIGLFQAPNNTAIMSALPRERLGSGGGMLAMARTLGMVLGVALSGALFAVGSGHSIGPERSRARRQCGSSPDGGWRSRRAPCSRSSPASSPSRVRGARRGRPHERPRAGLGGEAARGRGSSPAGPRRCGDRPLGATLQGVPLVLFRGRDGRPGALEDRCPHRNAPLAAGRVRGGELECAYHGWRFDGSGAASGARAGGAARGARHAAQPAIASVEQDGFVWVCSTAGIEPARPPPASRSWTDPRYTTARRDFDGPLARCTPRSRTRWTCRTPPSSTGASSARPEGATRSRSWSAATPDRCEAEFLGEPRPKGLAGRLLAPGGGVVTHFDRFLLPCLAQVEYRLGDASHLVATTAMTPVDDTRTELHSVVTFRLPVPGWLVRPVVAPIAARIFRQDARMLALQAKTIQRFGGERFASTELDVLGPQILRLLRDAERGALVEGDRDRVVHEHRVRMRV